MESLCDGSKTSKDEMERKKINLTSLTVGQILTDRKREVGMPLSGFEQKKVTP